MPQTKNQIKKNIYEANIPIYIARYTGPPVTATGAAPERCEGTVQLTSQSNIQVRQAGRQTFVQFDFTGLHDICLADGSVVTGIVEGHLVQRTSANGDFSLTFDEVLSYNGGTLGYRGGGSPTRGNWHSHVTTVGAAPARCGNPRAWDVCVHRPHIADRRHLLCVHALTRRVATRNMCLSVAD